MLTKALLALALGALWGAVAATGEAVWSAPPLEAPAAHDTRLTYRDTNWQAVRLNHVP